MTLEEISVLNKRAEKILDEMESLLSDSDWELEVSDSEFDYNNSYYHLTKKQNTL